MHHPFCHMVRFAHSVNALLLGLLLALSGPAIAKEPDRVMRIVAFGDSLTAGFGLAQADAFPVQLQAELAKRGHRVEIINAGVSGDTTAGGLARLDWAVPDGTDAVILELGANDALQGRPPETARANLDAILARLKARGIPVLLCGMRAPRNLGAPYVAAFDAIFPDLARTHGALLYPFFLDGVALDPRLSLGDGIHPNAKGITVIVERIAPSVEQLIARIAK